MSKPKPPKRTRRGPKHPRPNPPHGLPYGIDQITLIDAIGTIFPNVHALVQQMNEVILPLMQPPPPKLPPPSPYTPPYPGATYTPSTRRRRGVSDEPIELTPGPDGVYRAE